MEIANKYRAQEVNLISHIQSLRIMLVAAFVICLMLVASLFWVAREHRLSLPPEIRFGSKLTTNKIEPHEAYAFGGLIYQQLYLWRNDGNEDFINNIDKYRQYLSPALHSALLNKVKKQKSEGSLAGRVRSLQPSDTYQPNNVIQVANDRWLVKLDFILNESLNGIKIKNNVRISEQLVIIYKDIDSNLNPWGLVLDMPQQAGRRLPPDDIALEARDNE